MNTRHWILAALLLAVTACGGGGGGGGNAGDNNTGNPPPTANNAPTITGTPIQTVAADDPYSFVPSATDPDADALTFSITNQPFWASFNTATGELSGVPLNDQAGEYENIVIAVSDGEATAELAPFTLLVMPLTLSRDNFTTEGDTFPTDDGYRSVGTLVMTVGDREQRFEESDLTVEFDENGDLDDMYGETVLPPTLADNVVVDTPARAIVDVMSGAEIYADPDLDILLLDERKYIVYYLRAGVDLIITDPDDGSEELLKIETPLAGEILLIVDPTDPMYYIFGSQPLIGERGDGKSLRGLIPFAPELPFEELDSFTGHIIENATFGFSIKNIDVLDVAGTRVIKLPSPLDIDFSDPFNSDVEYRMGINGTAALGLGVFGFGLLDVADAQMSATVDVGLDRQSLAMQTVIEPAENWLPDWIPMRSETEINGEWLINGEGEYVVDMTGRYKIFLPEVEFAGGIRLDNRGATLSATLGSGARQFTMTSDFESDRMPGFVEIPPEFSEGLGAEISAAVDNQIAAAESAFEDLENAIADYEFEVSLRGLREQLPGISDAAVAELDAVPGEINAAVRSTALSYMRSTCFGACVSDFVDEVSISNSLGNVGESQARDAVRPIIGFMRDLKTRAQEADDASLRQGLEQALRTAARYKVLNRRVTVTHNFGSVLNLGTVTLYNRTFSERTMSDATANRLIVAADNMYRISETDSIRISTQEIFDALPVREVLDTVKQELAEGIAQIPTVEGVSFTLFTAGFEAAAIINGDEYPVEFNFFDPEASATGFGDLLATQLIDAKN